MAFSVDAAVSLLQRSKDEGRLAHAYLITGPQGSGKERLVLDVLEMVGQKKADALDHCRSDFVQVIRPESMSRRITADRKKVDQIRPMLKRVYMAVPMGITKVVVMMDADRLTVDAANVFLKTLEEPPAQSLILLVSSQPEQLLDTILSRCIRIPLFSTEPLRPGDLENEFLEQLGRHFEGDGQRGVSRALALMGSFVARLKEEKEAITKACAADQKEEQKLYRDTTDGKWLQGRETHFKALIQAQYLQRRSAYVQLLIVWFGDALRHQLDSSRLDLVDHAKGTAATANALTGHELLRRIEALEDLRVHLGTNVSEGLALETAFLEAFA